MSIILKVNVITSLEFELAYYDVIFQLVSHYTMGFSEQCSLYLLLEIAIFCLMIYFKHWWRKTKSELFIDVDMHLPNNSTMGNIWDK